MNAPANFSGMSDEDVLDIISDALRLESWSEGKTLTVRLGEKSEPLRLAKLRLVRVANKPSAADLRGEPE